MTPNRLEECAKLEECIKGDIRRSIQQDRTKLDLDQEILHVSHLLRDTASFPGAMSLSIGGSECGAVLLSKGGPSLRLCAGRTILVETAITPLCLNE